MDEKETILEKLVRIYIPNHMAAFAFIVMVVSWSILVQRLILGTSNSFELTIFTFIALNAWAYWRRKDDIC